MTIDMMREALLWCSIINLGLFFLSFLIYRLAHDWIYRFHGKWYNLSVDKFDAIYYAMMVFFKTCILFFNIVPYIVLCVVG
ncbi:MAG: hypothetical protein L6422_02580 [Candidatus Marinimicrobia bacterium]|nr:hypothetical protein [bacterium]MCG2715164.1 hypothetical protein [Candidatus Neomarinimicrobiota bacterium]